MILGITCLAAASAKASEVVSPAPLDSVLGARVRGGVVDYGGLARQPGSLRRYLAATAEARPERFDRARQMAFWINTYNARVLDGVIRRPGLTSVLDTVRARGFFKEKGRSGGREASLDDIERIVREFGDARVHFVLNCGSKSCPVLPQRALSGANLESALNEGARGFLADRTKNRWPADGTLELSGIFDWFRDDFVREAGSVQAYVARHWRGTPRPTANTKVRFLPYDWSLNGSW